MVGKDGTSEKTYSYTDYGETTEQGENDFYNEVCYGGGIYDKTTGLYYLNARYYSPENGSFLTQDTYRGSRSKTETLNLYGYCAGNPISYTDPSGHWVWGVVGAAMGAYDGYKYAKKKGYKGWKKYAAIAGGAALGVVNPFKVFKVARTGYKTYKAVKYSKKARAAYKATKVTKKAKAKPKHTVVMKKNTKAKIQSKPAVRNSKGIKKLQKSAGGTIGCFTAGTKIHTKDGFKAIENIKAGDYVWSENPETHEKALKKVKKIFVREKDSVVRLSINGEAIETTNEHPFYVEGHGWTNAYDLKVGDKVRLEDGTTGTVEKVKHVALDTPVTVYNFEVEDFHTYYVSEQKVLVHNTCASIKVAPYKEMKKQTGPNGQAHHLSQNAAFKGIIPKEEGLCIELEGNAITDIGSPHYKAHASLEGFWNNYRPGGALHETTPTIGAYNRAVYDSLLEAGISKPDAAFAVRSAYQQQKEFGLVNNAFVPGIPRRMNQKRP